LVVVSQVVLTPQQSMLDVQLAPVVAQPQVLFTQRSEEHSSALLQVCPSALELVPPSPLLLEGVVHVFLAGSQTIDPWQSVSTWQAAP
jgi:hypothetical protein